MRITTVQHMNKETLRFSILGAALFVAGLLQFSGIAILEVAPNFVLVVIVMASLLLRDFWHILFLLSIAAFSLKFSPSAERDIVSFFLIGLALVVGERKLPWHTLVNGIFLMLCATTALYLFVDRMAIVSLMFALELGYNVILTYALYHGLTSFRLFRHR